MAKLLAVVLCWVAVTWSRCISILLRWLLLAGAAAATHGSLRIASSEAGATLPPGVPLAVAFGFRCGRSASLRCQTTRSRGEAESVKSQCHFQVNYYGKP